MHAGTGGADVPWKARGAHGEVAKDAPKALELRQGGRAREAMNRVRANSTQFMHVCKICIRRDENGAVRGFAFGAKTQKEASMTELSRERRTRGEGFGGGVAERKGGGASSDLPKVCGP